MLGFRIESCSAGASDEPGPSQTVACACWCRTSSGERQLWRRRRLQPKPQTDVFGKHGGKGTQKHSCTWQDLAAARRLQKVAINQLETAQQAVDTLQAVWLREFQDRNTKEAEKAKQELNDAKQELNNAQTKLEKAKQELKEAKEAVASVRAGREQAGASACAVVAVAFGLQHSRKVVVRFRAVHRFCFVGSCSPLSKDSARR